MSSSTPGSDISTPSRAVQSSTLMPFSLLNLSIEHIMTALAGLRTNLPNLLGSLPSSSEDVCAAISDCLSILLHHSSALDAKELSCSILAAAMIFDHGSQNQHVCLHSSILSQITPRTDLSALVHLALVPSSSSLPRWYADNDSTPALLMLETFAEAALYGTYQTLPPRLSLFPRASELAQILQADPPDYNDAEGMSLYLFSLAALPTPPALPASASVARFVVFCLTHIHAPAPTLSSTAWSGDSRLFVPSLFSIGLYSPNSSRPPPPSIPHARLMSDPLILHLILASPPDFITNYAPLLRTIPRVQDPPPRHPEASIYAPSVLVTFLTLAGSTVAKNRTRFMAKLLPSALASTRLCDLANLSLHQATIASHEISGMLSSRPALHVLNGLNVLLDIHGPSILAPPISDVDSSLPPPHARLLDWCLGSLDTLLTKSLDQNERDSTCEFIGYLYMIPHLQPQHNKVISVKLQNYAIHKAPQSSIPTIISAIKALGPFDASFLIVALFDHPSIPSLLLPHIKPDDRFTQQELSLLLNSTQEPPHLTPKPDAVTQQALYMIQSLSDPNLDPPNVINTPYSKYAT